MFLREYCFTKHDYSLCELFLYIQNRYCALGVACVGVLVRRRRVSGKQPTTCMYVCMYVMYIVHVMYVMYVMCVLVQYGMYHQRLFASPPGGWNQAGGCGSLVLEYRYQFVFAENYCRWWSCSCFRARLADSIPPPR